MEGFPFPWQTVAVLVVVHVMRMVDDVRHLNMWNLIGIVDMAYMWVCLMVAWKAYE